MFLVKFDVTALVRGGIQYQVKPGSFITWSRTLGIDFPLYTLDNAPNWEELYKEECLKHVETQKELEKIKNKEKPINTKERESMLKIIIGTAIGGYGYKPKDSKSPIPQQIADDLVKHGISLSDDTVRKYLREAQAFTISRY